MNRVYQPLLEELNLTNPQYLAMIVLWQKDGKLVGELSAQLRLESNTLSPLLKRLEGLGYIERRRSREDERQVQVYLTNSGRELKDRAACIPAKVFQATGISLDELNDMIGRLDKLRGSLEATSA